MARHDADMVPKNIEKKMNLQIPSAEITECWKVFKWFGRVHRMSDEIIMRNHVKQKYVVKEVK